MPRRYTVIGQLIARSRAKQELKTRKLADPDGEWGLVEISVPDGQRPTVSGRLRLPMDHQLLIELETILKDPEVLRTASGKQALALVRRHRRSA